MRARVPGAKPTCPQFCPHGTTQLVRPGQRYAGTAKYGLRNRAWIEGNLKKVREMFDRR